MYLLLATPQISWQQAVKIDINIEKDLAYALKVKEGPQILFVRGNRILYKEKGKVHGSNFQVGFSFRDVTS